MTIKPARLAAEFSRLLREALTAKQMALVVKRNLTNWPTVCASHDFCDANMVMGDAFERLMGRELSLPLTTRKGQRDAELWNKAWDIAKAGGFKQ